MPATLIFCRTPLQSLIARRIVEAQPENDYAAVYAAVSASAKHRHYFEQLPIADKAFVPFSYRFSDALSEVATYLRVPALIRRRSFDRYLVASFNSLAFALLARRKGAIATYDDGSLSYNRDMLNMFIQPHGSLNGLVRKIARTRSAAQVVDEAERHFTIFPPDDIAFPVARRQRIPFLQRIVEADGRAGTISVVLGTAPDVAVNSDRPPSPEQIARWQAMHARAVEAITPDLFLPHPHTAKPAQVRPGFPQVLSIAALADTLIAEDLILALARSGYSVRLFGFSSTALIVLRDLAECTNLVIEGFNSEEVALFDQLRVPSVRVADLVAGIGQAA